jgi:hypothetical protein
VLSSAIVRRSVSNQTALPTVNRRFPELSLKLRQYCPTAVHGLNSYNKIL